MKTKGKQLVIFIPYVDKSTRKLGEDCVANGKLVFEEIKKSFAAKRPVYFGNHLIASAILVFENMSQKVIVEKDAVLMVHAYGGEINGRLRDDNRGEKKLGETLKLIETLIDNVPISEIHFAVCYSALKGHIAAAWKEQFPDHNVFGTKDEYPEDGIEHGIENETLIISSQTALKL